jgi:hypothetical protein
LPPASSTDKSSDDIRAALALESYHREAKAALKRKAGHAARVRWRAEKAQGAASRSTRQKIAKRAGVPARTLQEIIEIDRRDATSSLIERIKRGEITRIQARRKLLTDSVLPTASIDAVGIEHNEINIDAARWAWLREHRSKRAIKRLIIDAIERQKIPAPTTDLTESDARYAFAQLVKLDTRTLIRSGRFDFRHEYKLKPKRWRYIAISNLGNAASNFFHQTARFGAGHARYASPEEMWRDREQLALALEALFSLKIHRVNMAVLRKVISLRRYLAAQFRPSAAKAVYDHFKAQRVLAFSAGWGDRLAGFCASDYTREYFGCDPNKRLQAGYAGQIKLYGRDKQIRILPRAAEDCDFPKGRFDLCFTSPPYFDREHYSSDAGQSFRRYRDLDAWLEGFLYPTLAKAHRALRVGGILAINLSDVSTEDGVARIAYAMNEYIGKALRARYVDCWGLAVPKRPARGARNGGLFAEPIWIWRRN